MKQLRFRITGRIDKAQLQTPNLRDVWKPKLDPLPKNARAVFAVQCAKRVQPLLSMASMSLPRDLTQAVRECVTVAESSVTTGGSDHLQALSTRVNQASVIFAQRGYGPMPFIVALCTHFTAECVLQDENLDVACLATEMALEGVKLLPPRIAPVLTLAIERDYEILVSSWERESATRAILTPAEFFALHSTFETAESLSKKSIIEVNSVVNRTLLARLRNHPGDLYCLKPREFEEVIAEVFRGFGYEVELTKQTRDGGRDVIALKGKPHRQKCLIECKRYRRDRKIEVGIVRQLFGVLADEGGSSGILATTSFFTADAREFMERNQWQLDGKDYDGVVDWLKEYQDAERYRVIPGSVAGH